ncbi:MAG: MBL fold metallo-hydrolase, partial [Candidatus Wolfebacteria bacterium]|nr:MBL fold metallo-hydrolase [Candidatus Wolfebacteria bacterium]
RIEEGVKSVRIFGQEIPVRCKIRTVSGYSAHADQPKLLEWLKPMKNSLKKVFVVQGEKSQQEALTAKIKDELAIDAEIPSLNKEYIL